MHTLYVFNKSMLNYFSKRHLFSMAFLLLANAVNFLNTAFLLYQITNTSSNDYAKFEFIVLCFYNFFLLVYMAIAVKCYRDAIKYLANLSNQTSFGLSVNNGNKEAEFESFNKVNQKIKFEDDDENQCYILNLKGRTFNSFEPEEDAASYFAYLTFGWLQPLLKKGFKREIHSIQQLLRLPNGLLTF